MSRSDLIDLSSYEAMVRLDFERLSASEQLGRARRLRELLERRRSVRAFAPDPVDRDLVEEIIRTAASSPSGANKQPWRFVVVGNAELKREIRAATEAAETDRFRTRPGYGFRRHVPPAETRHDKAFLEVAPYIVVVFRIEYDERPSRGPWLEGHTEREKNCYSMESVGIATGMLITAIHNAGLVTVPHTPAPMKYLNEILGRPKNEHPFLMLPIGYPAEDAAVPVLRRKQLDEVAVFLD
jgi:nitroreductase